MSEQNKSLIKPILKWNKNLNLIDKRILWSFLGLIFILLLVNLTLESIRAFNSDLSQEECNIKIIKDVRYALSLQEENSYLAFTYTFERPIIFMLIAIGISWILHGVGFHLIKR